MGRRKEIYLGRITIKKLPCVGKAQGIIFLSRAIRIVLKDISVEELAADVKRIGELPHVALKKITLAPLSVPDGAT